MTQEEWEQHPIYAAFTAAVLDQLLDDEELRGICAQSITFGRPLHPVEFISF